MNLAAARAHGTLIFKIDEEGNMGHVIDKKNAQFHNQSVIQIPGVPLDHLIDQFGLSKVDILKIDIEGYEMECLKGAPRLLKITERFVLEYHIQGLYKECLLLLMNHGYILIAMGNLIFGRRVHSSHQTASMQ